MLPPELSHLKTMLILPSSAISMKCVWSSQCENNIISVPILHVGPTHSSIVTLWKTQYAKKQKLQRETMQSLTGFAFGHMLQSFLFTGIILWIISVLTSTLRTNSLGCNLVTEETISYMFFGLLNL